MPSCDIVAFEKMGHRTFARCQAAFKQWESGKYDYILVTGGMCHSSRIQEIPDAVIMRQFFLSKGVPNSVIITEKRARDTYENVHLSCHLLAENELFEGAEITVISTKQHCRRFRVTFWRCWKIKIREHYVSYYQSLGERFAEWLFYIIHLLDPWGRSFIAKWNRKKRTY